jgi:hypothetical protein
MMRIDSLQAAFRAKPMVRAQADITLNFVGPDRSPALFEYAAK